MLRHGENPSRGIFLFVLKLCGAAGRLKDKEKERRRQNEEPAGK